MTRRLALVIHALNSGGAERVFCALANHWAEQGHEVTVMTLAGVETDAFPVHPSIRRVGLGLMAESASVWQAVRGNGSRVYRLRQALRATGARQVVSFTDRINVLTLLASIGAPWDVVIAERNDPRRQWMGRLWEFLRRRTYPRCRALVVQTANVAQHLRPLVGSRPVLVIPNGVERPPAQPAAPQRERRIVALGRLTRQKGFDLLVRAFAQVAAAHPDWTLSIVGEGEQRGELESLIDIRQLRDRVFLTGWLDNPAGLLQRSAVFALSSRYEGFPNALLEALACGCVCVSFDCDSGPAEIIRHEVDGLLVPAESLDALAAALDRLLTDDALRRRLSTRAVEVADRFSLTAFFARWDEVLSATDRGP